jgi:hypothetical protein
MQTESSFPMIVPRGGSWYIVVVCEQCLSRMFLFRDLTEGKSSLNGTYFVKCPRCYHQGEYEGRHYQHWPKHN